VTDALTGLLNRSVLDDALHHAIAQNRRSGLPMTLISLDVDHFKAINDSVGHDSGDAVLRELGRLVKSRTRGSDMAFRVGGEEFLILAHNTDESHSLHLADGLREQVAGAALVPGRRVTVSMGVAGLRDGMDAADWVRLCDERLYQAKREGRNRVVA